MADSREKLPRFSSYPTALQLYDLEQVTGYLSHLQLCLLTPKLGIIIIVPVSSGLGAHLSPPHVSSLVTSNAMFLLTSGPLHKLFLLSVKYFAPFFHWLTTADLVGLILNFI